MSDIKTETQPDFEALYYRTKQENKVLLQRIDKYECEDLEKEGYFVLKGYVKQQIDAIKDFELKTEITKNPKDEKYYDRIIAIGKELKSMISELNGLRIELKITKEDEKKAMSKIRTTPESIANDSGNIAGQRN